MVIHFIRNLFCVGAAILWGTSSVLAGDRPSVRSDGDGGLPGTSGSRRGQFGGDLGLLRSFYSRPARRSRESNHYIDLWEPGSLVAFARVQGLTNNRALFIDSHGTERTSRGAIEYVVRPNAEICRTEDIPIYSISDLARVMGPEAAAGIHNIVVAGCNAEGSFKAAAFRRHFVNATNITHMTAGHLSYKPCFYQALAQHSMDIEPLYGRPMTDGRGHDRVEISRVSVEGSIRLGTYVAELFKPGAAEPYRRQIAGRELLQPGFKRSASRVRQASGDDDPRRAWSPAP